MKTFTEELDKLRELESEIVNLKDIKIIVPYKIDTALFYTFLKKLWLEKSDKYMSFPFPLINYIDVDKFVIKPAKPWGLIGGNNLEEAEILDVE